MKRGERERTGAVYDVVIAGAGASGLTAGIFAARRGLRVLVIEHNAVAGKKLLATGNGKCNFTNARQTPDCYRSQTPPLAWRTISGFDEAKALSFFRELGILPKERNGYYYPNSGQAVSVRDALLTELLYCGAQLLTGAHAVAAERREKGFYIMLKRAEETAAFRRDAAEAGTRFEMKNERRPEGNIQGQPIAGVTRLLETERKLFARALILATGGLASPAHGSDGSGYRLAERFGHTLVAPVPALVQLVAAESDCKQLSGVRCEGEGRLEIRKGASDGQAAAVYQESGEFLFTEYGISGIPVLQLSRFASYALAEGRSVRLVLNLLPELTEEALTAELVRRLARAAERNTLRLLNGLCHEKLNRAVLVRAGLSDTIPEAGLTKPELLRLVQAYQAFTLTITKTNTFSSAQVTAGGVALTEVQPETLESKLVKGLYLVGELLDCDGTCGGYNLQWAWSTGAGAGRAVCGQARTEDIC